MTTASYVVECDWDGDLTWDHAQADLTSLTLRVDTWRGRSAPIQLPGRGESIAGTMTAVLNNDDGKFSDPGGSIGADLVPGRAIRLRTTAPSVAVLWTGQVESIAPTVSPQHGRQATIRAIGNLSKIVGRQTNVAPQTSILTGAAVRLALDDAKCFDYAGLVKNHSSLVGYWRLDETSGNALDSSDNSNTGTVTGATQGSDKLTDQDDGASIDFDGATGDVDVTSVAAITNIFDGTGGTVEAWIKADSDGEGSLGIIVGKLAGWMVYLSDESTGVSKLNFTVDFSTTDGRWRTTATAITNGTAHHIAITYDADAVGNNPILYVDGLVIAIDEVTTPVGTRVTDTTNALIIGNQAADDRTFDGHVSEVAIYTAILTPTAIGKHYAAGFESPRHIDNGTMTLPNWWAFDRSVVNVIRELESSEFGFLWEGADGALRWSDRHGRLTDTLSANSQVTLSDAASPTHGYQAIELIDPLRAIFNDFSATVRQYLTGSANTLLWETPENININVGATITRWAQYPSPDVPEGRYASVWDTILTGDVDVSGVAFGDLAIAQTKFAQSQKIAITNNGAAAAVISRLDAKGTPVTEKDPVKVRAEDETSQDTYGLKTYEIISPWWESAEIAQAMVDGLADTYETPQRGLGIRRNANKDSNAMTQTLARDISDRVTVVADNNTKFGITSSDYYIESVKHAITRGKTLHTVEYTLSPVSNPLGDFILNVSLLDTGRLAL
jgi:hypothetical protein